MGYQLANQDEKFSFWRPLEGGCFGHNRASRTIQEPLRVSFINVRMIEGEKTDEF